MMKATGAKYQGMKWIRHSTRLAIYLRDGLACVWCEATLEGGAALTLDHVRPESKGGSNKPSNLVTACRTCNCSRGNRSVAAFARSVAEYRDHGMTAKEIVLRVRRSMRRIHPQAQALEMIKRRGSLTLVLSKKEIAG